MSLTMRYVEIQPYSRDQLSPVRESLPYRTENLFNACRTSI